MTLAVLIGLGGGVALAVAAGARRTASSFDTILALTNAANLAADYGPEDPRRIEAKVRAIEGVADVSLIVGFGGFLGGDRGRSEVTIFGLWNDPVTVDRNVVVAGRYPTGPDEAMATAGDGLGLRLGDHIEMAVPDPSFSDFETVGLDIVGIGFSKGDLILDERTASLSIVAVSRAFTERHLDRAFWGQANIKLGPGAKAGAVAAALARDGLFIDEDVNQDRKVLQIALRPLLMALAGLAALAAIATVVVAGQALSRMVRRRPTDDRSLRALGATRAQLVGADLLGAGAVAVAGVTVAIGVAVAASPLFPVGPARRRGLTWGVAVDLTVLATGAVVLVVAMISLVGLGSWHRRRGSRPASPRGVPALFAAHPPAATGLRLARAQRGLVATAVGVVVGMATVVACATFIGSLDRLVTDQSLVGMTWDLGAQGGSGFSTLDTGALRATVGEDPAFERVTGLGYYVATLNDTTVPIAVLDNVKGSPWPPVVAGRAPSAGNEILMGRATLEALDIEIGDSITLSFPEDLDAADPSKTEAVSLTYTVIGSAVAPAIGQPGQLTPKLGVGILLSPEALGPLAPLSTSTIALLDLEDDVEPGAVIDRFADGLPFDEAATQWFTSAAPAEVSQAARARSVIGIGVCALGLAVVATIVHTLLVSVRQRRREFAVLKALGFTRRQVRDTVLWQSGAILIPALVVAVPVGIAAGRWLWKAFAETLGIVVDPAVPLVLLAAGLLVTVLVAEAAAIVPATIARRAVLDRALRAE